MWLPASDDDPKSLELVATALGHALDRHMTARRAWPLAAGLADACATAAETLWWICALDTRLGGERPGSPYVEARDADDDGRYLAGLRWAAARVAYRQLLTTSDDLSAEAAGSGFAHTSPGFVWRPADDLRSAGPWVQRGDDVYERLVAGRRSATSLARACTWLETATGHVIRSG